MTSSRLAIIFVAVFLGLVSPLLGQTFTCSGIVAPGVSSVSSLAFASMLQISGTYQADANLTTSDLLNVADRLTLNPGSILDLSGTFSPSTTYTLANFASLSGAFTTVNNPPSTHVLVYQTNQIVLSPVPEPAVVLVTCALGCGLAGAIRVRFRNTAPDRYGRKS